MSGSGAMRNRFRDNVDRRSQLSSDCILSLRLTTIFYSILQNHGVCTQSKGKQFRMRVSGQQDPDPRSWNMFFNCQSIIWSVSIFSSAGKSARDSRAVVTFPLVLAPLMRLGYSLPVVYSNSFSLLDCQWQTIHSLSISKLITSNQG
jgi:hypothetical protein